jgi:signal transduction histidine kinase
MEARILKRYKKRVLKKYAYIDLRHYSHLSTNYSRRLSLTPIHEIFVDINFTEYGTHYDRRTTACSAMLEDTNNKIILAEPGRGKTTFLKYLLSRKVNESIIPIYWEWENFYDQIEKGKNFKTILSNYFRKFIGNGFDNTDIESIIEKSKFVFLIEEFDGVLSENHLLTIKKALIDYREIEKRHSHENYFVITSRLAYYPQEYFNLFSEIGFRHNQIKDLDGEAINRYIRQFIQYLSPQDRVINHDKSMLLSDYIENVAGIKELAVHPLFLNLIVSMYHYDGDLPGTRVGLFEKFIDMLIYEWKKSHEAIRKFERLHLNDKMLKELLMQTAYEYLYEFLKGGGNEFGTLPQIKLEEIITRVYADLIPGVIGPKRIKEQIARLFKTIKSNKGIIVEKANGKYGFSHKTLFEYLAAKRLKKEYPTYERCFDYIIEMLKNPCFSDIEGTILFHIQLIGAKSIDIITGRLLTLYREQGNKKILFLLAGLLKYEDISRDYIGDILTFLAAYQLKFPADGKIHGLITDIFDFSKRKKMRDEIIYMINKSSREKEKYLVFSTKFTDWVGQKATEVNTALEPVLLEYQHMGKSLLSRKIREQWELLKRIPTEFSKKFVEDNILFYRYDPHSMMKEIIEKLKEKYPRVEITTLFDNGEEQKMLTTDKGKIEQVIEELIKNSIKHSKNARSMVSISTNYCDLKFVIHYQDKGKGVPLKLKERIFEPFFSTDKKSLGTGLWNVKHVVENLHGEIKEIGNENEGVHFQITLMS